MQPAEVHNFNVVSAYERGLLHELQDDGVSTAEVSAPVIEITVAKGPEAPLPSSKLSSIFREAVAMVFDRELQRAQLHLCLRAFGAKSVDLPKPYTPSSIKKLQVAIEDPTTNWSSNAKPSRDAKCRTRTSRFLRTVERHRRMSRRAIDVAVNFYNPTNAKTRRQTLHALQDVCDALVRAGVSHHPTLSMRCITEEILDQWTRAAKGSERVLVTRLESVIKKLRPLLPARNDADFALAMASCVNAIDSNRSKSEAAASQIDECVVKHLPLGTCERAVHIVMAWNIV